MTKITTKNFKQAIDKSAGVKVKIAESLGVTRGPVTKYLTKHPEFEDDINEASEKVLDIARNNIINSIISGDLNNSKWFLERMDKDFYKEKKEDPKDLMKQLYEELNRPYEND